MSMRPIPVRPSPTTIEPTQVKDKLIGYGSYGVVWNVLDTRNNKRVALKKITKAFDTRKTALMVFRELRMLFTFKHDNVLAALEVMKPPPLNMFKEVYVLMELMLTDLQRIIWSDQDLSADQIRVMFYQIIRGLKYIHSARVIHRDIKPANILVHENCVLKICDFGMARTEVTDQSKQMCLNVVTKGYRAPEIILETKHYTNAIDIWAAACVFAELLGREYIFNHRSRVSQLDQMMNLLGTPSISEIDYASESMKNLVARSPRKASKIDTLHDLSPYATDSAVDLLSRMLTFDPTKRLSAAEILDHPYMDRGRSMYHDVLCKCCSKPNEIKKLPVDLEPVAPKVFDDRWEQEITSVEVAKENMHRYIKTRLSPGQEQLCINPASDFFKVDQQEDSSTATGDEDI